MNGNDELKIYEKPLKCNIKWLKSIESLILGNLMNDKIQTCCSTKSMLKFIFILHFLYAFVWTIQGYVYLIYW